MTRFASIMPFPRCWPYRSNNGPRSCFAPYGRPIDLSLILHMTTIAV